MKKWAVGAGILLLILTSILLTYYRTPRTEANYTQGPANTTGTSDLSVWECTGNFSANDIILVELLPNVFWSANASAFDLLDDGRPVMYVDMSIIDPKNSTSQYELWLTYDQINFRYSLVNASALSLGEGINNTVRLPPNFNMSYSFIAGTAMLDGTYLANVTFAGFIINYREDGRFKPSVFQLFWGLTTLQESHPYASLLYVSFATLPSSVIILVYGLKKSRSFRKTSNRDLRHRHLR